MTNLSKLQQIFSVTFKQISWKMKPWPEVNQDPKTHQLQQSVISVTTTPILHFRCLEVYFPIFNHIKVQKVGKTVNRDCWTLSLQVHFRWKTHLWSWIKFINIDMHWKSLFGLIFGFSCYFFYYLGKNQAEN